MRGATSWGLVAVLLAACGGDGDGGSADAAPSPDSGVMADGGAPLDSGVGQDTGSSIDSGSPDDGSTLDGDPGDAQAAPSLEGTFDLLSTVDFGAGLPRRASESDPLERGDCVDHIVAFGGDPGGTLGDYFAREFILMGAEVGAVEGLRPILAQITNATVDAMNPDWGANGPVVQVDLTMLYFAFGALGEIDFAVPVLADGPLAAPQPIRQTALRWQWRLPCADTNPDDCPVEAHTFESLGLTGLDVSGAFSGAIAGSALTIDSHTLPFPIAAISRAAVERIVVPSLAADDTVQSLEALTNRILTNGVIELHNADRAPADHLPVDGDCGTAATAMTTMVTDGGFVADIIATLYESVCTTLPPSLWGCLDDLDDFSTDGNVGFVSDGACPLQQTDADPAIDALGAPDATCDWDVSWMDETTERSTLGFFHATER